MTLQLALAIAGSLLGLAVTACALATVWIILQALRPEMEEQRRSRLQQLFGKWALLDYAVAALFAFGAFFLLADVAAVMRDRSAYPEYHLGYLLCGVVFSLLGMIFVLARLGLTLHLFGVRTASVPDHHAEPKHADHAEQRV